MGHITGTAREQLYLEAPCLDDFVSEDNIVRLIDAFIDSLDLAELGFRKVKASPTGRPPYKPQHLTKLYVYGYLNRVRSSRRLEAEAGRNVEVMWLLNGLRPDDKTICNFRSDNRKALKNLFKAFNRFCQKVEMFGKETCSIDGSKFKAANGRKNYHTVEETQARIAKLDAAIEGYLAQLDENDATEAANPIQETLEKLAKHRIKAEAVLAAIQENNNEPVCSIDPEAKLMKQPNNRGYDPSYNVQTAVDAKHGLIVDFAVTDAKNDHNQLEPMAFAAKEAMGSETINALGDGGYANGEQIHHCEQAGIRCYIPGMAPSNQPQDPRFHRDRFLYDDQTDTYTCPQNLLLSFKGIKKRGNYRVYYNIAACKSCPLRQHCTQAAKRTIDRHPYQADVERAAARTKTNRTLYARRKELSEHPFGTIKAVWGYNQFLCRGKEKTNAEAALTFLAFNLRRITNIKGTKWLLHHLLFSNCSSLRTLLPC